VIQQGKFEGMERTPWGCLKCGTQVVAEYNSDGEFVLHCGCLFAKPHQHGQLELIQQELIR